MYEQDDIIEVKPPSMRNKCRLEHSIDGSKSDIPLENFLINCYCRSQQKQRYPDIQIVRRRLRCYAYQSK